MRKPLLLPTVILSSFAAGAVFVQLGSQSDWWPAADSVGKQNPPDVQATDASDVAQAEAPGEQPDDLIDPYDYETDDYPLETELQADAPLSSVPHVVLVPEDSTATMPDADLPERISSPVDVDEPAHYHSQPDEFYASDTELIAYPGYYEEYYPRYESRYSSVYFSYFDFPYAIYSLHYRHRPFYLSYNDPYYDWYNRYVYRDFFYVPTRYKWDYRHRDGIRDRRRNHHWKDRLHNKGGRLRDHRYADSDHHKKRVRNYRSPELKAAQQIARDTLRHRSLVSGDRTAERSPLRRSVTITPLHDETTANRPRRDAINGDRQRRVSYFDNQTKRAEQRMRRDRNSLDRVHSPQRSRTGRVAIPERQKVEVNTLERQVSSRRQTYSNSTISPVYPSRAISNSRSFSSSRVPDYRSRVSQQRRANANAHRARPDMAARQSRSVQRTAPRRAEPARRVNSENRVKRQIRRSQSGMRSSHNRMRSHIKR